jgi:NADH dehydrogenase
MTNICILGGGGFVGRNLASQLARSGYHVTVPTRQRQRIKDLLVLPGVEVVEADIHDSATLEQLIADQDTAINLVGILHGSRKAFERAHVELPVKIMDACQVNGVRRFLHMSALGADTHSKSVYQQTKGEGEQRVLSAAKSLDITIFRPSVIFGPGDSFLNLFADLLKLAPVVPLANGRALFQPVHVTDVARAFALAIDDPATFGQAYDLCGPQVYSLQELVRIVADTLGLKRTVIPLNPSLSLLFARLMELKPGKKLMTRDNHYAMQVDNVCAEGFPARFGQPAPLEANLGYLFGDGIKGRYDLFREAAGR